MMRKRLTHAKLHLGEFSALPAVGACPIPSVRAIAAAYFAHFGLTIPEWRVMAVLAANPGLSAAEVTARTAMDKVAVSRAVATLLVGRPPAPHHGARRTGAARISQLTRAGNARLRAGGSHGAGL